MKINQKSKNIIILTSLIFLLVTAIIVFISINKNSINKNESDILEVKIVIKDHRFIPNLLEIPRSTKIRLIIQNDDDTVEEFESRDLHREKIIMPHDSINIILAPLAPGKYDFFGDFHQDTAQGSIIVKN
ncbi:MAG: cupredoxin domain-containing protein [Rickettsia endosymbiont of Argas persicus]